MASLLADGTRTQARKPRKAKANPEPVPTTPAPTEPPSPAGQSRSPWPWELPDYRPAPAKLRAASRRIRQRIEELRPMLDDLADQLEALDLADVRNGFTEPEAAGAARAARSLEWSLEAAAAQLDWIG